MFGLFKKDPVKKLKLEYASKLKEAMVAQRSGDIFQYSQLTEEANKIFSEIESIEKQTDSSG
jgi:hypothetical protein